MEQNGTTVTLPRDLYERLSNLAARDPVNSVADLVQRAIRQTYGEVGEIGSAPGCPSGTRVKIVGGWYDGMRGTVCDPPEQRAGHIWVRFAGNSLGYLPADQVRVLPKRMPGEIKYSTRGYPPGILRELTEG